MATIFDKIKDQIATAKVEYKARRRDLERQIEALDREYGALLGESAKYPMRGKSTRQYGGVKHAVLGAVKDAKGIKPAEIAKRTGLSSAQVHNSLTGLKKSKQVRVKDGLYTAV